MIIHYIPRRKKSGARPLCGAPYKFGSCIIYISDFKQTGKNDKICKKCDELKNKSRGK